MPGARSGAVLVPVMALALVLVPALIPALALALTLAAGPAVGQTVIAAATIRARSVISAADLTLTEGTVPGGFSALSEVAGQEARTIIYAGRPILKGQVGPPALVARNQVVKLIYSSGALTISTEGRALGRAGKGETVRVMNIASRATVTGIVTAPGTVRVMP